jgi:hypothetical protein
VAVAVAVVDVADDAVGVEDVLEEVVVVVVVVEDVADEAEALQQQVVSIRRMRYSSFLSLTNRSNAGQDVLLPLRRGQTPTKTAT